MQLLSSCQVTIGEAWVTTVPGGTLTFSAAATAATASFNGSEWNVLVMLLVAYHHSMLYAPSWRVL